MLAIIEAIKTVIDERVVSRRNLTANASAGVTTIKTTKAIHFSPCDCIAILEGDCSELHTVASVEDGLTLTLAEPLARDFTTAATIEKVYQGQTVDTYLGDPPALPRFPAITVDLADRSSEPLALQGLTQQAFTLPIRVYVSKEDFDTSFRLLHELAERTERMLYTVLHPLVRPYVYSTLTADVDPYSTTIAVADPDDFGAQVDIILESDASQANHRIGTDNGDGTFDLVTETDIGYPAGSTIIRQLLKVYDTDIGEITYRDAMQNETTLKVATLLYTTKVARLRGVR